MLIVLDHNPAAQLLFVGRPMPNGAQVLVPKVLLPLTCRRTHEAARRIGA